MLYPREQARLAGLEKAFSPVLLKAAQGLYRENESDAVAAASSSTWLRSACVRAPWQRAEKPFAFRFSVQHVG